MPNQAIWYDEWLCTCGKRIQKPFCRAWGRSFTKISSAEEPPLQAPAANQPRRPTATLDARLPQWKKARERGTRIFCRPPRRNCNTQSGTRRCTTNRSPTGQCNSDSRQGKCRTGKQREQVKRAQEKLNRVQAEAMEADKKVTTLRAEALTAAHTQEGQKLSPRDYFEKIAKGLAAVKESLKEGEKKSSGRSNWSYQK